MVLIHDRILKIDIYNFEMSQITPEKSLKSNQIYSVQHWADMGAMFDLSDPGTQSDKSCYIANSKSSQNL